MKRIAPIALLLLPLVVGCDGISFDTGFEDDDGGGEGVFPRITETSPIGSDPVLRQGDPPQEFSVAGSDKDSLELDLVWYVSGMPWSDETIATDDGTFQSTFTLSYEDASAEGFNPVEVEFEVVDPQGNAAQASWLVDLGLSAN